MSKIARKLTGLTKAQLRESDFKIPYSKKDTFQVRSVVPRGNPRFRAGLTIGFRDRDDKRKKL